MSLLGQSAGLLFKIDADSSGVKKEFAAIDGSINSLGGKFGSLADIASVGVAGIAAIGAIAVTVGQQLFSLAMSASEYGSSIFDAKEKTGLTAETLSVLRVAADNAGSSFEGISGSVSKFAVLVGQANQGNEKAIATLEQYGIKSRDLNGALNEAIAVIAAEKDETLQAAAAKDLFKDRTGQIIPVIKQLGGDLKKATEDAKRLGLTLSEDDVKAADDLGDAFGVLSAQIKAGASRFALQYAPQITGAIQTISNFVANNSGVWAEWGRFVSNTITGTWNVLQSFGTAANNILSAVTLGLVNQSNAWPVWSQIARGAIAFVTFGLSELVLMLEKVGGMINGQSGGAPLNIEPGAFPTSFPMPAMPKMPTGGGGRGDGQAPKAPKDDAEREAEEARRKLVDAALRTVRDTLEIYKAGYALRIAELDAALTRGEIIEKVHIRDSARVRQEAIQDEINLNKGLLKNEAFNLDERAEILQKLKVLEIELRIEKIKGSTQIIEQIQKENEELEKQRQKLNEISTKRANDRLQARIAEKERLEEMSDDAGIGGGFGEGLVNSIQIMVDTTLNAREKMASALSQIKASWASLGEVATGALDTFAQGIGNIVQNLVLMGTAGPNAMRKLVASVLAGVAAQAAVLAVFELAKGFAALFFNPAEAKAHFIAAALFGSIAVGAGLAGRAIAGDSFKSETSSATGGSSGGGNGNGEELRYTTAFAGYGGNESPLTGLIRQQNQTLERQIFVLGQVEETVNQFNTKVTTMSPDHVVAMGAAGASRDIREAYESELGDSRATDGFMRQAGFAR